MTSENGRALDRLYEAVWNGTNSNLVGELVHDEYLIHDRKLPESGDASAPSIARYNQLSDG